MPYLMGLDISTTGAKALIINETGGVIAVANTPQPISQPKPLWSEQNPADWWDGIVKSICAALAESGLKGEDISAIGLTGQMHGLVLLDSQGEVLRPSILWNDQRTQAQCDAMTAILGQDRLIELTGNPAVTGFTAPKILWVRDNEPDIYAQVAQVLLPKDYIRYKLTDAYATDLAGAAGTSLLNVAERAWSQEVLDALEIPGALDAAGPRRHPGYIADKRCGRGSHRACRRYAGGRRRWRSSGGRHRHGLCHAGQNRCHRRHIRRGLRAAEQLCLRAGGTPARLLSCRTGNLALHGRHAQRGRQLAMVQGHLCRRTGLRRLAGGSSGGTGWL